MSLYSHALKLYAAFRVETSLHRTGGYIAEYTPTAADEEAAMVAAIHSEAVLRAAVVMAGLLATKPKEVKVSPTSPTSKLFGRDPYNPNGDGNPPPRYA